MLNSTSPAWSRPVVMTEVKKVRGQCSRIGQGSVSAGGSSEELAGHALDSKRDKALQSLRGSNNCECPKSSKKASGSVLEADELDI